MVAALTKRRSVDIVPARASPDRLARYAGAYQLAPDFLLTVSVDHRKLMVPATGQPALRVYPVSDTEFVYRVVDARIRLESQDSGTPSQLIRCQGGAEMKAPRVE